MSEKNESRTQAIRGYVDGKIQWLWDLPENQRRAELAKLRRGIGHAPGELPDLWGGLLQGMPASFYGTNGPSHEEWAGRTGPRAAFCGGSTRWLLPKKLPRSAIICGG